MRMKRLLAVGFLSIVAASAAFGASDSFAASQGSQRVDVIDHLPQEGVQLDSMTPTGAQSMRVDVIDGIGNHGPVYPSTSGAMRVDVIERTRV